MRGASALQDLLRRSQDPSLRVFVVWEPVIWSDLAPPLTMVLGRVSDQRAAQLWDRGRLVSADMLKAIRTEAGKSHSDRPDGDTIVWDCVAIYPPGARWDATLPPPDFIDCPVVAVIDEVRRRLSSPPAAAAR